jgi:thiol:disulfide interchange protein DsbA
MSQKMRTLKLITPSLRVRVFIVAIMVTKLFALELAEVFSFSCIHCYNVEPQVQSFAQNKQVKFVPIPLYDQTDINEVAVINAYFAAADIGKQWKFRQHYYDAVFVYGMQAYSKEALAYTLSKCELNNKAFYTLASSSKIRVRVQHAVDLAIKYNVSSTPTFIVDGTNYFEGENAIQEIITN